MKPKFGREIALLALPIAILGGSAWWRWNLGSSQLEGAPADLTRGAARLEVGSWRDAKPLPSRVGSGFEIQKTVTVWQGGQSPVPDGTGRLEFELFPVGDVQLVFRRGAKWQSTKAGAGSGVNPTHQQTRQLDAFTARGDLEFLVSFKAVPRDAQEVHLRGQFISFSRYRSGACGAAKSDPRWKIYPSGECEFVLRSKPFDVSLKMSQFHKK